MYIHRSVAMDLDEHYFSSENGRDSDDTKTKTYTAPRRVESSWFVDKIPQLLNLLHIQSTAKWFILTFRVKN